MKIPVMIPFGVGARELSGGGWQCVQKKAGHKRQPSGASLAVQPSLHRGGRYYRQGEPEFDALVRQVTRVSTSLPSGIGPGKFARLTYAVAHDGASAGDNLGVVYLTHPPETSRSRRAAYGVDHVWAPGSGGGQHAGHRDEWRGLLGLPVDSRKMLARVIMAALTDVNAEYRQKRMPNGNIERSYGRFAYRQGGRRYALSHIRVVLGPNGMVITAYPLPGAKAQWIGREASASWIGCKCSVCGLMRREAEPAGDGGEPLVAGP